MIPPTKEGLLRQEQILSAAVGVAQRIGYMCMTRDEVATAAKCATGSVHRYFVTMENLRTLVMKQAISDGNMRILGQGLAMRHPVARKAPKEMKAIATSMMI